jgi:hypothetical protein
MNVRPIDRLGLPRVKRSHTFLRWQRRQLARECYRAGLRREQIYLWFAGYPKRRAAMSGLGRGCGKTQFAPGGEQDRVATEGLRERRIQTRVTSHNEIAYCRYGTTFSHSLGRKLLPGPAEANVRSSVPLARNLSVSFRPDVAGSGMPAFGWLRRKSCGAVPPTSRVRLRSRQTFLQ